MKKFTKRLTMIVAILLSLVLLTSSIVSTTLAKYVVTKSAEAKATLDAFGVTVDLDASELGTASKTTNTGDSISFEFSNLILHPDDVVKTISASVHGEPSVDAIIVVDVEVKFDEGDFSIGSAFTDLPSASYFPIEFKVGDTTCSEAYTKNNADAIESAIESKVKEALVTTGKITPDGGNLKWSKGAKINQGDKNVSLSFSWPKEHGSVGELHNEIGTYIAKKEPTFTITYKISVEQA